jgi:sigma-E factor negative regulatory protein RseC
MNNTMEYEGVIIDIYPHIMYVQIKQQTACHDCHVQKACGIMNTKEKVIEIPYLSGNHRKGDTVCITGKASMGLRAVCYAFMIPLLIVLFSVILASRLQWNDLFTSAIVLGLITLYYIVLYFFRNTLKQKFTFTIK